MSSLVVVVALFVPLREGVHVLVVEQGVVAVSPREFLLEKQDFNQWVAQQEETTISHIKNNAGYG